MFTTPDSSFPGQLWGDPAVSSAGKGKPESSLVSTTARVNAFR